MEKERLLRTVEVGHGRLYSVAWSPDSTRLAVGDYDGGVSVYGVAGDLVWRLKVHESVVWSVAWSPDGRALASASADQTVWLGEAEAGRERWRRADDSMVFTVSWSPAGERLSWGNYNNHVRLATVATGEIERTWDAHAHWVWCVAWSPAGNALASGSADRTICLFDPLHDQPLDRLEGHENTVYGLCWSPDGRFLASASADKTVRVWDLNQGKNCTVLTGHTDEVITVAWRPDGGLLASAGDDKTIRLWLPTAGRELLCLTGHEGRVMSVAFSPDSRCLASVGWDETLRLWDVADLARQERGRAENPDLNHWLRLQAASVGRLARLRVAEAVDDFVPVLAGAEGACLGRIDSGGGVDASAGSVALFPDSRRLALGTGTGKVRFQRLATNEPSLEATEHHAGEVLDCAISPDGRFLATGSYDRDVRLWDAVTGQCRRVLRGHGGSVRGVCWSPAGDRLASASDDQSVRIWHPASGDCLHVLTGHTSFVQMVDWSPDGRWLASCSSDETVRLWNPENWQCEEVLTGHTSSVFNVAWSPNSQILASVSWNSTIRLWHQPHWGPIDKLRHRDTVRGLAWSPDSLHLATGSWDHTIRLWDILSEAELARFKFPEGCAHRLAWAPNGAFLVSSHEGDIVRFWDVRPYLRRRPPIPTPAPSPPLTGPLRHLPLAAAWLHRLNIHGPLSLLRDLLALTGGREVAEPVADLAEERGIRRLAGLRWPTDARIGLLALLLKEYPAGDFRAPAGATSRQILDELRAALAGPEIEETALTPALVPLRKAAAAIDERVLALLATLGPKAVAADPGLPLRLLPKAGKLPPLGRDQRHILGLRLPLPQADHGRASTGGPGIDRAGIEMFGDFKSLLPSQLALPKHLLAFRHLRGELLYRARLGQEPPRLRPLVILLDVSPPCLGPLETVSRLAAHCVAQSLLDAGLPAILVIMGGRERIIPLETRADLLEIHTQRSLHPADPAQGLRLARGLLPQLRAAGPEPAILLITHPWFGEEADLPAVPRLRGLFVNFPRHPVQPLMAGQCEHWHLMEAAASLDCGRLEDIGRLVGRGKG